MFTVVSSVIDFVFDVLFSVAKKLIGLAFFTFLVAASIVTSIIILAYNIN